MVQDVGQRLPVDDADCDGPDDAGADDLVRDIFRDPEEGEEGD
jgi:hypothetical protein